MDTILTSASNPTIKRLRKLTTSNKARREENAYIAEGIHLVKSFLLAGKTPTMYVLAESALRNPEVNDLVRQLAAANVESIVIADSLFESIMSIHASVGVCILFSPEARSTNIAPLSQNAALLEGVQDPGNLGTILRTAAAVGVKDILLSRDCSSPWSPKALRAGMGAQFSLVIHEDVDLLAAVSSATIPTLATTLRPDSQPLFELDLNHPVAWLFGSEGQGISDELSALASMRVSIPQASQVVESLNVAAAAAVCLYEQYRQSSL